MTTPTPPEVFYTYEANGFVRNPTTGGRDLVPLPVTNIIASMDRDRIPYVQATIETGWIDDTIFSGLDPRIMGAQVFWSIRQWAYDDDGVAYEVSRLPDVHLGNTQAEMRVRDITRDPVNGTATIELYGAETFLEDKKRNSGLSINTGATTVSELVYWAINGVFSGYAIVMDSVAIATPIPAGERRLHNPEESHIDLIQPELDAIDCRLIGHWRQGSWEVLQRTTDTGTVKLGTYTDGVPDDVDPIVYAFTETMSRNGDWADGVLVKYDTTDKPDGTGTIVYQASGAGANTRGRTFTRKRAAPASNGAELIAERTVTRGYDVVLTARARFDIDAFRTLEVHTPNGTRTVRVRSVEWNVDASEMSIRGQYGEPEQVSQLPRSGDPDE